MQYKRGMRAKILRPAYMSTTNTTDVHVISGNPQMDTVYVVGDDVPESYPVPENAPTVHLVERVPGYIFAKPSQPVPEARNGWMASGAYIVHNGCFEDWFDHFEHVLPIPLHDRAEKSLNSD